MTDNLTGWHLLQVELHAARQYGDRNFLRVSRRKNKFNMRRWLFQCLEHGVECVITQHMHFIDHIDLEARVGRCIHRLLE